MEEQGTTTTKTEKQIIEATKENVEKNKGQLEEFGKVDGIEEVKTEEDGEEVPPYFYVTVDNDVYKVEGKGTNFIGEKGEFPPVIKITKITNTTNSITVTVKTLRNEGGKVQYYLKGDKYTDYKLINESNENTYTFSGLKQGVNYSVKIVAIATNKKTAEVTGDQTTGNVTNLTKADLDFTYTPSATWTNQDVTVTVKPNIDIGSYKIRTSKDGKTWETTNTQTFSSNGQMYVILWDGTNYGVSAATAVGSIDKNKPVISSATATSNAITIKATDEASGIVGYAITTSNTEPTQFTAVTSTKSFDRTFTGYKQGTTYYTWVKDAAGNVSASRTTTTGTVTGIKTGDVTFTYSPSTDTNQNVTVTISGNNTGYKLQYKTEKTGASGEVTDWTDYTKAFTVTRNQKIYARVADTTGQVAAGIYATGNVTNIDKLAPKTFTPKVTAKTTNSITVDGTTTDATATADNASSGIKEYRFSKDGGSTYTAYQTSNTYTFEKLTQNKSYTIKVEARDKAGNTTVGTASITTGTISVASGATCSPTTWTNGNVKVTLPTKSGFTTVYTKDGSTPTKSSTKYTSVFEVSSNCKINYLYTDGTNIGGAGTLNISIIDKKEPTAPTITNSSNGNWTNQDIKITLSSSDSGSGIAKYQVKYSGSNNTWTDVSVPDTWSAERNETVYYRAVDKAGNVSSATSTAIKIDKSAPTFSSAEIKNVTTSGYDVYVYGVKDAISGVNRVQFPTWTKYKGQDDLQQSWDTNTTAKGTKQADGTTWVYHVNIANHNNEYGKYMTHIYFYDELGNCSFLNPTDGEYTIVKDPNVKVLIMEDRKTEYNNDYKITNDFKKYFTNVTYNNSMTAEQMIKSDYNVFIDYGAYWSCNRTTEIKALYNAGKNLITVGNDNDTSTIDIIKDASHDNGYYVANKVIKNSISDELANDIAESDGMNLIKFKDNVEKWYTTTVNGEIYDVVGCLKGNKNNRWIHSQFYAFLHEEESCDKQELVYYAIGKR